MNALAALLPGVPPHPSLGIPGWVAILGMYAAVAYCAGQVVAAALPTVRVWLARRRRVDAEFARRNRIGLFTPRPMPGGWEPNPRDPSPQPRKRANA